MIVIYTKLQFPKLFSFGIATKTGPNEKILENSRMSLTLIGHGTTSVKPPSDILKEITHRDNTTKRTTIIKVIFFNYNYIYLLWVIYINIIPIFEIILYLQVKAKNPGYGFTSKAVILGAITIIKDKINIPKGYTILFKNKIF